MNVFFSLLIKISISSALVIVFFSCQGQGLRKDINDAVTLHSTRVYLGDTVFVLCDTLVVMNRPTFRLYNEVYQNRRNSSAAITSLVNNYQSFIDFQEQQLKTKEEYYQKVKREYDSLTSTATDFVEKASDNIAQVSNSLGIVTNNLTDTQKLLLESKGLLIEERKLGKKRELKYGLGGLAIGVTIAILAGLLSR